MAAYQKPRRALRYVIVLGMIGLVSMIVGGGYLLYGSLPTLDGRITLKGLAAPVNVKFDGRGIPRIEANTRLDAFRTLGFVTARDRLFQMDMLRRSSAGTLAEILGPGLLEADRWHKTMGFNQVTPQIFASLSGDQQGILRAYAEGVNEAIANARVLPFEFLILGYQPTTWIVEDSLLVVLGLYETLSWSGDAERMTTVMEAALPPSVVTFLTPDSDCYTQRLSDASATDCRPISAPLEDIRRALGADSANAPLVLGAVRTQVMKRGSNAWVVGPAKSKHGRALLANDMHLQLNVPNIWYRAELQYGDTQQAGFTLPGLPLVVGGTNRKIAWGFTNIDGVDNADLILLDIDPTNNNRYATPHGPDDITERVETIHVRGASDESLVVRGTEWGPILPEPLLGRLVAIHWTALDPKATNLNLLDLDRVATTADALEVFNSAGGSPMNAFVADNAGNIGWTLTGRIPVRSNFDGLMSRSWSDGSRHWEGYIAPQDLPRLINPSSGFLVNANQKMVGTEYPYVIGYGYGGGYRAYRITQRLREMNAMTERDMLDLQLDTQSEFYRYYQKLALRALNAQGANEGADEFGIKRYLGAWDGRAEKESEGLPLLVEFRHILADAVLTPLFTRCRAIDPTFAFGWATLDEPLQSLLDVRLPELLPDRRAYPDWDTFFVAMLKKAARNLLERHHVESLQGLSWGLVNRSEILHPLADAIPLLGRWLNMPIEPVPGCDECVRWSVPHGGATERLVVSPGRAEEGILHMPGGQSGHPLSAFYQDQHHDWVEGESADLLVGPVQHQLRLEPLGARPSH